MNMDTPLSKWSTSHVAHWVASIHPNLFGMGTFFRRAKVDGSSLHMYADQARVLELGIQSRSVRTKISKAIQRLIDQSSSLSSRGDSLSSSGWLTVGSSLFVLRSSVCAAAVGQKVRVAAFDLDYTLVVPRSGRKFPLNRHDWKWLYAAVPARLRELHAQGFVVAVFSNQASIATGKESSASITGKILDMATELGFPLCAAVSGAKDMWRKPNTAMWTELLGARVDLAKSFYCGDAAGRPKAWRAGRKRDFSCSDRKFAINVGIAFHTPEEFFHSDPVCDVFEFGSFDPRKVLGNVSAELLRKHGYDADATGHGNDKTMPTQELIICVGSPASGKSSWVAAHLEPSGYVRVNQDTLRTKNRCVTACKTALESGASVVIDNTNPKIGTRALFIKVARSVGVPVRCFRFTCPKDLSMHLNIVREQYSQGSRRRLPAVVFHTFYKRVEEPTLDEGFTQIVPIHFVPALADSADGRRLRRLLFQWT